MTIEEIKEAIIQRMEQGEAYADLEAELTRLREDEARQRERAELQAKADRRKAFKAAAAEVIAQAKAESQPVGEYLALSAKLIPIVDKLHEKLQELADLEKRCRSVIYPGRLPDKAKTIPRGYLPADLSLMTLGCDNARPGYITATLAFHLGEVSKILKDTHSSSRPLKGDVDLQNKLDRGEI